VDAGGDMRFFGPGPRDAALRVGPPRRPLLRALRLRAPALACSSPAYARATPSSSTRYARRARAATVAAVAPTCARADALTKVGLFADARTADACAAALGGFLLRFDGAGRERA
jgi:thiamine biosynthesis lipoprotein ApbE